MGWLRLLFLLVGLFVTIATAEGQPDTAAHDLSTSVGEAVASVTELISPIFHLSASQVSQGSQQLLQEVGIDESTVGMVGDAINGVGAAASHSLPTLFRDVFSKLSKGILARVGSDDDNAIQDKLRSMYRRMLLIWKDMLKSDIGHGNPLVTAVVTEWMRDLIPLQVWSSISSVTVNQMTTLMQTMLKWSQDDENCVPQPGKGCSVDPIRMQFAVEMMRACMPLVLTGQLKIGLITKFLKSFKRISGSYPRLGFQILGLMRNNPPLMLHSIMHIFSKDGNDLDSITGTTWATGTSPDIVFYELNDCVGAAFSTSLDADIVDMCMESFNNGHGVNRFAKSIKLSPNSMVKLVACPDSPNNKDQISCSGNMQEDCEALCQYSSEGSCMSTCQQMKVAKQTGRGVDACSNPQVVKCVRSYISEECVNLEAWSVISYAWGKTLMGASDSYDLNSDKDCPTV